MLGEADVVLFQVFVCWEVNSCLWQADLLPRMGTIHDRKESVRAILREVLADRAYESIKEAILGAELLAGRVLSIEDLANTLGI